MISDVDSEKVVNVYLDECGYTGNDLFNSDQPVFTLASHVMDEPQSKEIKDNYFRSVKSKELKHSSLSKYPKQQAMVLRFLEYMKTHPDLFKISVNNKRFVLICKIVDLIVEPFFHDNGMDIYEKGFNIAFSNLMYLTIPAFTSESSLEEILASFQHLARTRTRQSYQEFATIIKRPEWPDNVKKMFEFLTASFEYYGEGLLDLIPENALDLAFTSALVIMQSWRNQIKGPIRIIHDSSSNMSAQKNIWDAFMDDSLEQKTVGYDRRTLKFPIGVQQTFFESSKDFVGLQLADVVAGAAARAASVLRVEHSPDEYGEKPFALFKEIKIFPLLPEPKVTPNDLGTTGGKIADPLEFLEHLVSKAKKT